MILIEKMKEQQKAGGVGGENRLWQNIERKRLHCCIPYFCISSGVVLHAGSNTSILKILLNCLVFGIFACAKSTRLRYA